VFSQSAMNYHFKLRPAPGTTLPAADPSGVSAASPLLFSLGGASAPARPSPPLGRRQRARPPPGQTRLWWPRRHHQTEPKRGRHRHRTEELPSSPSPAPGPRCAQLRCGDLPTDAGRHDGGADLQHGDVVRAGGDGLHHV
jgi:hypothetical protein